MYIKFFKRLFDIVISLFGIIILSPVLLAVTIAIKIDDPGPAIFKQQRFGINKTFFYLYKFRSMKLNTPDVPTHLLENPEQYISKVGRFIRKISLDELPQLVNILRGDMSFIGPRPALWSQEDLIAERDKYGANDVLPGLTGWAQINGRDELEIPEKAQLDGVYAKNISLRFDIKCFLGSFSSVIKAEGFVEGAVSEHRDSEEVKEEVTQ